MASSPLCADAKWASAATRSEPVRSTTWTVVHSFHDDPMMVACFSAELLLLSPLVSRCHASRRQSLSSLGVLGAAGRRTVTAR